MAIRDIILSAYGQGDTHCFENTELQRLVGRFVDELKPWEKLLYETEGEGTQDLWLAHWDDEKHRLSISVASGQDISISMTTKDPIRFLLPALLSVWYSEY